MVGEDVPAARAFRTAPTTLAATRTARTAPNSRMVSRGIDFFHERVGGAPGAGPQRDEGRAGPFEEGLPLLAG